MLACIKNVAKQPSECNYITRMHSSRMRTARTVTIGEGGGGVKTRKKIITQTPYIV